MKFGKLDVPVLATLFAFLPPVANGAQAPSFPAQVELVTVDAVVIGEDGEPVPDLERGDFTVLERGVPQQLASFEAVKPQSAPATPGAADPRVVTNQIRVGVGSTFLFVFDDVHLTAAGALTARRTLEHFLRGAAHEGDRVTIVSTGTRAAWSGTVPAETEDLLAFVARLKGQSVLTGLEEMTEYEAMRIAELNDPQMLDRVMGRYYRFSECSTLSPCDARIISEARAVHEQYMSRRERSLAAMERALDAFGSLRGRKTVVLLSEGFVRDDGQRSYKRVVAAAQQANAAIYYVDTAGLASLPAFFSAAAPRDGEPTNPKVPDAATGLFQYRSRDIKELIQKSTNERGRHEQKIGVETIAGDTGGFVVRSTNDVAPGLRRIVAESRSYYLLGYYPSDATRDGRFRTIEVRSKRPGLQVRARAGYFAPRADGKDAQLAQKPAAPDPLVQPFETASDVPLRLASYALEPAPERKTRVVVVAEVDIAALQAEEKEGRRRGRLQFRMEAVPREGAEVLARAFAVEAELPAEPDAGPLWRALRQEFLLPSGVYRIRAVARDAASGKAGAVAQRFVVPEHAAFRISTPILTDQPAPAGADAAGDPAAVAHRQFPAESSGSLVCHFEVFGAAQDPATRQADVSVQLELRDGQGRTLAAMPATTLATAADGRMRQLIALPRLPAGSYGLALVVEDKVGGRRDEWRDSFVVGPLSSSMADERPVSSVPAAPALLD